MSFRQLHFFNHERPKKHNDKKESSMDVKTIAKLADIMSQHMLTRLEVQEG